MDNRILKWIWLANRCGVACKYFKCLWEFFGSIDNIYTSTYGGYILAGVPETLAGALERKICDEDYNVLSACENIGAKLFCYEDEGYPGQLRGLKNPPILLYCLGDTDILNRKLCIGIVGTRNMSEYGMRAAYKIAYEVASANAVVVSGMALGIDGVASCAAIASGGQTVAVLGCGIDVAYPKEHGKLKEIIKFHGAIVTEFPPMTPPNSGNFPIRNRIISGLSSGVVVVDADRNSGSMITAKCALVQGRDIYAVPGNIDEESSGGTNMLLLNGAVPATNGRDIVSNYTSNYPVEMTNLNIVIAENKSEFNPETIRNMGVGTRVSKSAQGKKSSVSGQVKSGTSVPSKTENAIKFVPPATSEVHEPDRSGAMVASLNEKQRKIFESMPLDRPVTVDSFASLGYSAGEIMSSLMVLELKGLVETLPGALFIRK